MLEEGCIGSAIICDGLDHDSEKMLIARHQIIIIFR